MPQAKNSCAGLFHPIIDFSPPDTLHTCYRNSRLNTMRRFRLTAFTGFSAERSLMKAARAAKDTALPPTIVSSRRVLWPGIPPVCADPLENLTDRPTATPTPDRCVIRAPLLTVNLATAPAIVSEL